jgi:hypothetical protein
VLTPPSRAATGRIEPHHFAAGGAQAEDERIVHQGLRYWCSEGTPDDTRSVFRHPAPGVRSSSDQRRPCLTRTAVDLHTRPFGTRRIVGISCSFALQPAHDARQLPSCRYHVNCARLLWGSHDGDNSQFYIGMVSRAWNFAQGVLRSGTAFLRAS